MVTLDVATTIADRSTIPAIHAVTDISAGWRERVCALNQSSLAHSPEWFSIVQRAYGHQPLYLTADDGEGACGVLPAFVVRRPLLGTVVTSMPFLDSGGPCGSSRAITDRLVERLLAEGRRIGAALVELRCGERLSISDRPAESKVNMILPLEGDPDRLWRQLDKGVRNQIRKAERSGLSVETGGAENLTPFYAAFVARMRDLGSPAHALRFLRLVVESFGDRARIALVRKGRVPIGGLVALAFKDGLVVPWAACFKEYFALCPNMLLYWEILKRASADGFRRFDFGRSSRDSGTYRFKRQWGAREEPLFWYTIAIDGRQASSGVAAGKGAEMLSKLWQRLPLPVTRHLGPPIRKYLTQ